MASCLSTQPARPNDVVYGSLSLDVEVGKTLALVGPSGGGKSTMTKLLLRFYDPTSGAVMLDGQDIKTLNVAWYRQQVCPRPGLLPRRLHVAGSVSLSP